MEKVRPWCGQLSDRGRLKIRSAYTANSYSPYSNNAVGLVAQCELSGCVKFGYSASEVMTSWRYTNTFIIIIIIILIPQVSLIIPQVLLLLFKFKPSVLNSRG